MSFRTIISVAFLLVIIFAKANAQTNMRYMNAEEMDDYYGYPDSLISKNKIKITNCYTCYVLGNSLDSCLLQSKTLYDTLGRIISKIIGQDIDNGTISLISNFIYKPNNNITVSKKFFLNPFTFQNFRYIYSFNAQGLTTGTKYEKTNDGEIDLRIEYQKKKNGDIFKKKFDYRGKLSDTTTLLVYNENVVDVPSDSTQSIFGKTRLFRYHDNIHGRVNVQETIGTNDKITERLFFTVDSSKNVLNYDSKYIYLYDSQGRIIREILAGNNNDYGKEKRYSYNKKGVLISYVDDSPDFKTEVLYDDLGRQTKIIQIIGENISSAKFTYDAVTGLCVKQETYVGDNLKTYEKFEYFR